MPQALQEFTTSRGIEVRVDPSAGIIHGVKVIGLASLNNRRYLPAALAQAASLYENTKVNVNHPKGNPLSPRDYQDRIGTLRNVRVQPDEGLFADFHFNPRHALAEQLVWDAQNAPENVGFSHNVLARTTNEQGQLVVHEITRVQSVDLVADPATTRGLFEANRQATEKPTTTKDESLPAKTQENNTEPIDHITQQLAECVRLQLAPQLEQLQQLIEQQTQLLEAARSSTETPPTLSSQSPTSQTSQKILSREQTFIEHPSAPCDPAAFAKSISI